MALFKHFYLRGLFAVCMLAIALPFVLTSCDKDDDDDIYYVKYEIDVTTSTPDATNKVGIVTESLTTQYLTLNGTVHKEITCGPVREGFTAAIIGTDLSASTQHTLMISVSKNNGPFALKAVSNSGEKSITYTIDD